MLSKKFIHFLVILLVCVVLRKGQNKRIKSKGRDSRQIAPSFHDVDAFGDDFVDFGAQTGDHGQFSWHADFPIEQ
jgi:hypothetical protein